MEVYGSKFPRGSSLLFDPQIGLLAVALIPLMATAAIVQMQMMNGSYGDANGLDGGAKAGVILGGALNGVTTVAAFNMQDATSTSYEEVNAEKMLFLIRSTKYIILYVCMFFVSHRCLQSKYVWYVRDGDAE